ncbi:MAG: RluA family pseudouridine synthase [Clostridiales bacterium]|nr:RluA family pseudouridine synthase [Clostridiales bacterium]
MKEQFEITQENNGERLDVVLSSLTGKTRSNIGHLIDMGKVCVDGKVVSKSGTKVKCGNIVSYEDPELVETVEKKDIPLDIIYNDSDIAVINKQQGLTVHPSAGNYDNTLVNGLMFHLDSLSGINGEIRPGIVHRLDKDTSGIMVVAKNDNAHVSLSSQIEKRSVKKVYLALLEGNLKEDSGKVVTKIGRNPKDRKTMAITPDGREAITTYKVLERFKDNCLVAFRIHTGRTHQIRVHAKYLLHPVVGDATYGYKKQRFNLSGQLLHSFLLGFNHPTSGEYVEFTATLPDYFTSVLSIVAKESGKSFDIDNYLKDIANID